MIEKVLLECLVVFEVGFRFSFFDSVEGRLSNVEMPCLHHLQHLPIEKGQQQSPDMGSINIGVCHDDDSAVAKLLGIEFRSNRGSECRDDGFDFVVRKHAIKSSLLHIQNLASKGKDGLITTIPSLLRGASCRVALDQVQFALVRVFLLTVCQLSRKVSSIQNGLSARQLPRLSSRFSRP